MSHTEDRLEEDRRILRDARERGPLALLWAYVRLSGPGWLQSAITLGGGSLASSLYLGVLAGVSLLWLQPVAMAFGIIMLGGIGYVTLSTGARPFQAINKYVNPVLGWGWALASLVASMVWCLPQYSLANGVLQQNLWPGFLGPEGPLGDTGAKLLISGTILVLTTAITWSYDRAGWGIKLYEGILKAMVAVIVISFFLVVLRLATSEGGLDWGSVFGGFIPDPSRIFRPAPAFQELLASVPEAARGFWRDHIVSEQRDVLVAAAATAVGINMTFLFPYSLLRRGWGKEFRGLAIFDLSTGMFIPFVLATSCVIIASYSQLHARPPAELEAGVSADTPVARKHRAQFEKLLERRIQWAKENPGAPAEVDPAEERIAKCLVRRDAFDLARSLRPLTGGFLADVIFGIGVLGMTLSTITLLMLISGFVVCEILGLPPRGWPHRLGSLAAAVGALGPFVWAESKARFWLAVPTSIFGFVLMPIAYLSFLLLMNQPRFLGDEMPRGGRRLLWNLLMGTATAVTGAASIAMVWVKSKSELGSPAYGMGAVALFLGSALAVHLLRRRRAGG